MSVSSRPFSLMITYYFKNKFNDRSYTLLVRSFCALILPKKQKSIMLAGHEFIFYNVNTSVLFKSWDVVFKINVMLSKILCNKLRKVRNSSNIVIKRGVSLSGFILLKTGLAFLVPTMSMLKYV